MESTVTPAPSRSTRPHISWPKVRSCGLAPYVSFISPRQMCRSEPHTPARVSRTRMAPASTAGTGYSRSSNSPPYALSTATRPFMPSPYRIRGGAPLSLLPRAPPPARETSGQEVPAQDLPHHGRELQALRVDALVVAVEHDRVFRVRDARRVQAEAVGGNVPPAEKLAVGPASRQPWDDAAPGQELLRDPRDGIEERRVRRAERSRLRAPARDRHARGELSQSLREHGVDLVRGHPRQRADVHVDLDAIRDDVGLHAAVDDVG